MDKWDELKEILEYSIRKYGNEPLTTQYLVNLMNVVDEKIELDCNCDLTDYCLQYEERY